MKTVKILWLSNMAPSAVEQQLSGNQGSGLWMDRTLADLRQRGYALRILCRKDRDTEGRLDSACSYRTFRGKLPQEPVPELEPLFRQEIKSFHPDVIHIWGSEFAHCLAMVRAAEEENRLDRTVVSIQGLVTACALHYTDGLPRQVIRGYTLRDFLRQDNLRQQQEKFALRGENEQQALALCRHVMGRTRWDREWSQRLAPKAAYHFCNETLREAFYEGQWSYEGCQKHRIFASSCLYPIKGFHYLLEAFAEIADKYPDAVLAVPGTSPLSGGLKGYLRADGYAAYLRRLICKNHLQNKVEFLGHLGPEEMKAQYLKANVFVLPSTIENSPNSMGEAMLLGAPVTAADVGGVTTMLESGKEGLVYQGTAPYMLADCIERIFAMGENARTLGENARAHALKTHDPAANLAALLKIYEDIGS